MALPLIAEDSRIVVTTPLQSVAYIDITLAVLKDFGIEIDVMTDANDELNAGSASDKTLTAYVIRGGQQYTMPDPPAPEGDRSNAAFWLAAAALGSKLSVTGLDDDSPQGDKAITSVIEKFTSPFSVDVTIDASQIPDLVPVISVLAALKPMCTRIVNAGRLRIKESDRLKTTCRMLSDLGADIIETEDGLEITGKGELKGGTVSGEGDHRIVMAAAIAATCCKHPVTIIGAQAASKSYPAFFEHYEMLGGKVEYL